MPKTRPVSGSLDEATTQLSRIQRAEPALACTARIRGGSPSSRLRSASLAVWRPPWPSTAKAISPSPPPVRARMRRSTSSLFTCALSLPTTSPCSTTGTSKSRPSRRAPAGGWAADGASGASAVESDISRSALLMAAAARGSCPGVAASSFLTSRRIAVTSITMG